MAETIDELVAVFVSLRDELDAERKKFKQFEADQKVLMENIETKLLDKSRELGVESFRTKSGTAYKTEKTFVRVGNWDMCLGFIKETGNYHMLEKRIGKLATLEILKENPEIAPSEIGVEYVVEEVIQVRRS